MNICVIAPDFPTSKTIDFVFVEQLCRALCLRGENVIVVAPQSLTKCLMRKVPLAPHDSQIIISETKSIRVIRPKYLTIGNFLKPLNYNKHSFDKAVYRSLKKMNDRLDVIYGHFWQSARAAYSFAKKQGIPLFVASGEEHISQKRIEFTDQEVKNIGNFLAGVINVSTNNQKECVAAGLCSYDNSCVIPNSIDNNLFKQFPKETSRESLGINKEDFVVAYVGQMTQRKGPLRLDQALKRINDQSIKAMFIGKGDQHPTYTNIIIKGTIQHSQLPIYLSAADVFVLPTLHEGCCNAIVEALACGLPVVSSDLPFNYDILDECNSILVDPENIEEIESAIRFLKDNPKVRMEMSQHSIEKASDLTLEQRTEKIISFIKRNLLIKV